MKCSSRGKVYIVGAGPGDPGLITLKGLKAIREADVIIVDRLVNPEILRYRRRGSEIIYVGKRPGDKGLSQDYINRLMEEYAFKGLKVVRLKGGDPIVFGRGGEEMEYLSSRGVCFEVVPGVSSIYSVPIYAGVPVTHRRYSSSLLVVPGMEALDKEVRRVRLKEIGGKVDTIVVLMGVGSAGYIARELIEGGVDPRKPVAIIERGSYSDQRTILTTLECLQSSIDRLGVSPPAVIVIGDVVRLSRRLMWFGSSIYDLLNEGC